MTLIELAERCEQASGPDRETDTAIHTAVTSFAPRVGGVGWPEGALIVPAFPGWKLLPSYTASIDAAATLVPDCETGGQWWSLQHGTRTTSAKVCIYYFQSSRHDHKPPSEFEGKCCATPALALCAAALRARAS